MGDYKSVYYDLNMHYRVAASRIPIGRDHISGFRIYRTMPTEKFLHQGRADQFVLREMLDLKNAAAQDAFFKRKYDPVWKYH